MRGFKTVDAYIESEEKYGDELRRLREILNQTELEETVKWGGPAYTYEGKLLVGLGAFKHFFALWFHQGALLADEGGYLINAQEGKTKALRQWRMTSKRDIKARLIKAYVKEAILLQASGKQIKPVRDKPLVVPTELESALGKNRRAKTAFGKLTKGKQREYADHIADVKRAETKLKRIEKILPMICAGQGLHDKYRNC